MITLYISKNCPGCLIAKKWLDKHKIPYITKNILIHQLNEKEIKALLVASENGTEDIISKKSKIIKKMKSEGFNFDNMSTEKLINFIQENPSVLRRPILIEGKKLVIGFDEDPLSIFISRKR